MVKDDDGWEKLGLAVMVISIVALWFCVHGLAARVERLERAAEKIESSQAWEEETGR